MPRPPTGAGDQLELEHRRSCCIQSTSCIRLAVMLIALAIALSIVIVVPSANDALIRILCSVITCMAPLLCYSNSTSSRSAEAQPLLSEVADRPSTQQVSREVYLDNLKVLLTMLVINHHSLMAVESDGTWFLTVSKPAAKTGSFAIFAETITGLNQSYFMSLFFFISGLFTPLSYDKCMRTGSGGWRAFLRNKFQRLGVPFLLCLYVFGPLADVFVEVAVTRSKPQYTPDPRNAWFLAWLLVFNCCFCFIGGACILVERPSLILMVGSGLVLGLLQGLLAACGVTNFAMMPVSALGNLPFDIVFFACGCCASAKRKAWLGTADDWWDAVELPAFIGTVASCAIYFVRVLVIRTGVIVTASFEVAMNVLEGALGGLCTIFISVWLLASFRKRLNYTTELLSLLSNAAFAVYVIHPYTIVPLAHHIRILLTPLVELMGIQTAMYIEILHSHGVELKFSNTTSPFQNTTSTTHLSSTYAWGGWAFICIGAQVAAWSLAHLLRKLPFVRYIL